MHETAVIGPDVTLGAGNPIGPSMVILGRTSIGDGNRIGSHLAMVGPDALRRLFGDEMPLFNTQIADATH